MTRRFRRSRAAAGLTLCLLAALALHVSPSRLDGRDRQAAASRLPESAGAGSVTVGARSLLDAILSRTLPTYPPQALAAKSQGVVVATLSIGQTGNVERVEILQAPSPVIGDAVKSALATWRFREAKLDGRPIRVEGKLVFYFDINGTKGQVTLAEPATVGGGGDLTMTEISGADLSRLSATERIAILDVRDRLAFAAHHRPNTINIPIDELIARAGREIDRTRRLVLDCSSQPAGLCRAAVRILGDLGLGPISVVRQ